MMKAPFHQQLVAAKSSFPSASKSPGERVQVVNDGFAYVRAAWNVPSPLPSNTLYLDSADPDWSFATTRSTRPSPLKSPEVTEYGAIPVANVRTSCQVPSPFPSRTPSACAPKFASTTSSLPSPFQSPMVVALTSAAG